MAQGKTTQRFPYVIQEEPGIKFWCACGMSKNQPYCDGSHKGSEFTPIKHVIEEAKKIAWCGCRTSSNGCLCDGSHAKLPKA